MSHEHRRDGGNRIDGWPTWSTHNRPPVNQLLLPLLLLLLLSLNNEIIQKDKISSATNCLVIFLTLNFHINFIWEEDTQFNYKTKTDVHSTIDTQDTAPFSFISFISFHVVPDVNERTNEWTSERLFEFTTRYDTRYVSSKQMMPCCAAPCWKTFDRRGAPCCCLS